MPLVDDLKDVFAQTLVRKASQKCSDWAQNYVVLGKPLPGPLRFERFPWSKKWHDNERSWAGRKAAQMAMTASALNRAIWTIDVRRIDVLYILPKKNPDAADFSKAKFDSLLELSPHLRELFSNVRNIGHKQAGSSNLYIRGARSRSGLKSISVGEIIYDEYDEMPQANVSLAEERASGYEESDKQEIKLSTPTIPDYGIDAEYQLGNQQHFMFKCLACGRWTELLFPECLEITAENVKDPRIRESFIKCKECGKPIPHEGKSDYFRRHEWVPTANRDSHYDTFWIPQLYSTTVQPWRIARSYLRQIIDPTEEQEFYNSKLGLPHISAGATVNDDEINECQKQYTIPIPPPQFGIVTMGIDVGKVLHYEVNQWFLPTPLDKDLNTNSVPKVLASGITKDFEQLDLKMHEFNISHAIIDYEPETRKAQEFANRFPRRVHLAYPHRGLSERQITIKQESSAVGFRRTSWLDLSQGRFKRKAIILPANITEEYREAIKTLVRIERKNDQGDMIARYISKKADHEAFARMYNELALVFAVSGRENQNIEVYL